MSSKEFKLIWINLISKRWEDDFDPSEKGNPKENKAGNYRFRRQLKSWKNYRNKQWKEK